jgi:hypothetical protein
MTSPATQQPDTFDQFEPPEVRIARWEAVALAAGREVDRNALRAYMAVADAELKALADNWAQSVASSDMEIRRLRARIWWLERPMVEAKRNEVRSSYTALIAQAEQDRDYEGKFDVECRLREREEQWAAEDASAPTP